MTYLRNERDSECTLHKPLLPASKGGREKRKPDDHAVVGGSVTCYVHSDHLRIASGQTNHGAARNTNRRECTMAQPDTLKPTGWGKPTVACHLASPGAFPDGRLMACSFSIRGFGRVAVKGVRLRLKCPSILQQSLFSRPSQYNVLLPKQ